jgi:hypothetical protein
LLLHMRELWKFVSQMPSRHKPFIGDIYEEAFSDFLFTNRIPKEVPRVSRQKSRIMFTEKAIQDLKSIAKIARKRKQSLSAVLEECILQYLSKPENTLSSKEKVIQRKERIS